ncbi:MAG: hypothetical protein GXY33_16450 [Phycisphaerae bacterium]|nr:hypothetical protein [Phycisphaerae bacterium]
MGPDRPDGGTPPRRRPIRSILPLLLLPLLYILSMGPIIAGLKLGDDVSATEDRVLCIVYYPVIWLHDHTVFEKPLRTYAEFWGWGWGHCDCGAAWY